MDGEGLLCSSELFIADAKMGGSLSHSHAFGRLGDGWRVASLEALCPIMGSNMKAARRLQSRATPLVVILMASLL